MNLIRIDNSSADFDIEGVSYDVPDYDSITIEDPRTVELTRGANASNADGIPYTTGNKAPIKATIKAVNLPVPLLTLFQKCFEDKKRFSFNIIDKVDGSLYSFTRALFNVAPFQADISDSEESMAVDLVLISYNFEKKLKAE